MQTRYIKQVLSVLAAVVFHCSAIGGPADTLRAMPTFIIEDAYGKKLDCRQKNKVVFINFWALTCAPCKAEMPGINALRLRFKDDTNLMVLPVDVDHNFAESSRYMYDKSFNLPVYTPSGVVPQMLFQGELPTTVVADKKGNIVFYQQGEDRYDTPAFIQRIDSLLRQ